MVTDSVFWEIFNGSPIFEHESSQSFIRPWAKRCLVGGSDLFSFVRVCPKILEGKTFYKNAC
jgi:hypothetical protein